MDSFPVYPDDRLVRLRLLQRYMSAGIMSLVISRGGLIVSLLLLATGGAFIVVGRFFFGSGISYTAVESIMQRPSRLVSALPIGSGTLVVPSIHPP